MFEMKVGPLRRKLEVTILIVLVFQGPEGGGGGNGLIVVHVGSRQLFLEPVDQRGDVSGFLELHAVEAACEGVLVALSVVVVVAVVAVLGVCPTFGVCERDCVLLCCGSRLWFGAFGEGGGGFGLLLGRRSTNCGGGRFGWFEARCEGVD